MEVGPKKWVSGWTLQPSIEPVIASSSVPSDFLVECQVSGLGTVHPLLTYDFITTWFLPLHMCRQMLSSIMDGLLKRDMTGDFFLLLLSQNIFLNMSAAIKGLQSAMSVLSVLSNLN